MSEDAIKALIPYMPRVSPGDESEVTPEEAHDEARKALARVAPIVRAELVAEIESALRHWSLSASDVGDPHYGERYADFIARRFGQGDEAS